MGRLVSGETNALSADRTRRGLGGLRDVLFERGVILLLVLFALALPISNARIAATDEAQYYVYLTSLRFDGDMNFANDYQRLVEMNPKAGIDALLSESRIRPTTGLYGNIAPVGSALLWSPFFLLADGFVHLANAVGANIPADGFSKPYILAACYASALYALAGLLLCYRMTRHYASQFATTLATLTIWFATPLVFYMFVQMGFAHANGFFLVALFLYVWHTTRPTTDNRQPTADGQQLAAHTHEQRSWRAWAALGLIGGLMTITREQLGLFLLLPALEAIGQYWRILFTSQPISRKPRKVVFASLLSRHIFFLAMFLLALTPQLATYQILNGEPRPAREVGGKFNGCSPHWADTLVDFDPRPSFRCYVPDDPTITNPENYPPFAHGAFVWSPVLPIGLLGLLLLWRRDRFRAGGLLLAFLAQTYLNGAFGTTWHLTGSFGFRRLIECSPIFIVGLALGIDWAAPRVSWRLIVVLGVALIVWNIGLIANWTVLNTELREGLQWPELWQWQLEMPVKLLQKVHVLFFNRCELMENGC